MWINCNYQLQSCQILMSYWLFRNSLGQVSSFNKSINRHHHMKDHVEIGHLTKYDAFRVNRDQVMDLKIWLKIHTNVSNCETVSPKIILTLKFFMISMIHLSFFQVVGAWQDFTVVTKLIKNCKSLNGFGGPCLTVRLLKPGPPTQWKPIRRQNWNNRLQHFQIQPIKCPV